MTDLKREFLALRKAIVRYVFCFLVVFSGLLALPLESSSYAGRLFLSAKNSLVPEGIPVVATGPVSAFVAPIVTAFLVAILVTFPLGIFFLIRFLRPALRREERRTLSLFVLPSLILFYGGCALAYFLIIPTTFRVLYGFSAPMGVEAFFALDDFISSVFFLTVSVGLAFLLPVVMIALSRIGIVPGLFWLRHWRGAMLAAIVFSAVITPDGSGVTMAFLSVPLVGLYVTGAAVAARRGRTS